MHILVKKGLDIPIEGNPDGPIVNLPLQQFSYDVRPFSSLPLRLLVNEGDVVRAGDPLLEDKSAAGRVFVAPTSAKIVSIIRGEKRRLHEIVLLPIKEEIPHQPHPNLLLEDDREKVINFLLKAGLFCRIRSRPFNILAKPQGAPPKSIFVKAIESAPFVPSAEIQLHGRESAFTTGLKILKRLTDGPVHVVTKKDSPILSLCQNLPVTTHTVEGPHPCSSPSLHIQYINPITSPKDIIWTVSLLDVITIGQYCLTGSYWVNQVIAIAGTGLDPKARRLVKTFPGASVESICHSIPEQGVRLISGNPLTGVIVGKTDCIRHGHTTLCAIPEATKDKRTPFHFLRLERKDFTATDTYFHTSQKTWPFTTGQHGEVRPFIDGSIYENVMPFSALPMLLVKALLAGDMEKAMEYGLLEIIPEDFALADFICPSKIDMMHIIQEGQQHCLQEVML